MAIRTLLIAFAAWPSFVASAAEPPIIEAAKIGNLAALQEIVKAKAQINARGSHNQTALHVAAAQCNPRAAQILIDAGIDPKIRDGFNRTAGMIAKQCSDSPEKNRLLSLLPAPAQPEGANESFPWSLQDATARGSVSELQMLLKLRGDVNAIGSKGNRALEIACRKGNAEVAKILLDHGADVHLKTSSGTEILHEAALGGNAEVIDLLIAKGANIRAVDTESGSTPLHYAASFGRVDAVKALIRHGAEINRKNNKSRTPLDEAISNQQDAAASILRSAAP